jgi:hypothetical protein
MRAKRSSTEIGQKPSGKRLGAIAVHPEIKLGQTPTLTNALFNNRMQNANLANKFKHEESKTKTTR